MRKVFYHILALPFYFLALLPFPLFYLFSDGLFLLGYYVIGYRKKVIHRNLSNAFPEKTEAEIRITGRKYFRFMIDVFLETFKLLLMTERQIRKRFVFINTDEIKHVVTERSVIFVLGHYGNWEWCGQSFYLKRLTQLGSLYHPLSNGFFEWLMMKLRTRNGVHMLPMSSAIKEMVRRKNQLTATAFIADQTPSNPDGAYWTTFLNQDTPVFIGTEKIARKMNLPVIYVHIERPQRGYYTARFEIITETPADTPEGWISERHTRLLEADIVKRPELWLWSHRRWKHKRKLNPPA
jgi:KDO2-lipid IV(A) lauroyltransferase